MNVVECVVRKCVNNQSWASQHSWLPPLAELALLADPGAE